MPNGFCISFIHSLSANTQARHHPKPPRPYDLGLRLWLGFFVCMEQTYEYMHQSNPWTRSTSICTNQTSGPSNTHALQQFSHPQFNTDTGTIHAQISPCQIPQACIPLSYAAQISTTRNPDLANVRVTLTKLNQHVCQCSVRFFPQCMHLCECVYV